MASLFTLELSYDLFVYKYSIFGPGREFLVKEFASTRRVATYIHSFNRRQLAIPVVL